MKRLVTICAISIMFLLAVGQRTFAQLALPIRLGVTGGIHFANQTFSPGLYPEENPKTFRVGSMFGGMAELGIKGIWSLHSEPRFIQKGTKFQKIITSKGFVPTGMTDASFRLNYFEIPFLLKAKFEDYSFKPFLLAGPTFGFINSAKVEAPGTHVLGRSGTSTVDIENDVNSFEVGLEIGAGVEYELSSRVDVLLSARYSQGLNDIYSNPIIPSAKSYGFFITTGVFFDITGSVPVVAASTPEPTKNNFDTDGDGLLDNDEIKNYRTNPYNADSDGDGLTDGDEVLKYKTNPLNADTDDDGLSDGKEVIRYKTDPLDPDTDHGSVKDGPEVYRGTDPLFAGDDVPKKEELKLEVGKSIVLDGIVFQTGKAEITAASAAILEKAFNTLYQNPDIAVEIHGHTDNVGKRNYNMKLSLARAGAVKEYLVQRGIDPRRITSIGFGFDRQIATNDTPEGRQRNRRIEFYRVK